MYVIILKMGALLNTRKQTSAKVTSSHEPPAFSECATIQDNPLLCRFSNREYVPLVANSNQALVVVVLSVQESFLVRERRKTCE